MSQLVNGIHHITAIASDPGKTVDFYTRILGLRLVKKTVNQDDVSTYHLFFGDTTGEPGMDLTFFTFQPVRQGKRGRGQVSTISLAVPDDSLEFWQQRFEKNKVKQEKIKTVFDNKRLTFYDFDEQRLELVGVTNAELQLGSKDIWSTTEVSEKVAIRYFYSAKLSVGSLALIEPILTHVLNYHFSEEEQSLVAYVVPSGSRAVRLELEADPSQPIGEPGAGTVHHIAFAVNSEEEQLAVREKVTELGLYPTEVINRYYFKSVYFRVPAGILFEIATAGPGFTADEPKDHLGERLSLPPFLEPQRKVIEAHLEPIKGTQ